MENVGQKNGQRLQRFARTLARGITIRECVSSSSVLNVSIHSVEDKMLFIIILKAPLTKSASKQIKCCILKVKYFSEPHIEVIQRHNDEWYQATKLDDTEVTHRAKSSAKDEGPIGREY